jgi:hypothetical protein
MEFNKKLDFLMSLSKTTNSMLARQLSLDASYISRLRTGTRLPAKDAGYLRVMAAYFARRCSDKSLTDTVLTTLRRDIGDAAGEDGPEAALYTWLSTAETDTSKPLGDFLYQLSSISVRKPQTFDAARVVSGGAHNENAMEIYYGVKGKREAVVEFLNAVIRHEAPTTLLLSSEENLDWLTEDREFTARWAVLLQQTILRGNRIKIIHHISRNLDEMLSAITEWLPIYMSGMVEPYYYPKTRDGIFQRTLFVAPGVAAILSTSVTGKIEQTANYLIRDNKAVEAAAVEFSDYFALCRPLLRVFDGRKADEFHQTIAEFESGETDTFLKTDAMSPLTVPADIYNRLCAEIDSEEARKLCARHIERVEKFKRLLQTFRFHEIIKLPDIQAIRDGECQLFGPVFYNLEGKCHTVETYRRQLENMIDMLRRYDNYHIYIDNNSLPDNHIIYYKEHQGVFIMKTSNQPAVFAISESKMTAAFSDYFVSRLGRTVGSAENKRRVIDRLEAVLKSI